MRRQSPCACPAGTRCPCRAEILREAGAGHDCERIYAALLAEARESEISDDEPVAAGPAAVDASFADDFVQEP